MEARHRFVQVRMKPFNIEYTYYRYNETNHLKYGYTNDKKQTRCIQAL